MNAGKCWVVFGPNGSINSFFNYENRSGAEMHAKSIGGRVAEQRLYFSDGAVFLMVQEEKPKAEIKYF